MDFMMEAGGLPAGNYRARFEGVEPYSGGQSDYGPGCRLSWQIEGGEQGGKRTSRIVSAKMTPRSALTKFANDLAGREIKTGERFNFADFIGRTGDLLVEPTESGGTRVAYFIADRNSAVEQF